MAPYLNLFSFRYCVQLDYECCDEAQGLETYAAILSVYYNKSRTCKARAYVKLTSENEGEVSA